MVWEVVLTVIYLVCLKLESVRIPCAAPSSAYAHVTLLIDDSLAVGSDILHVYWPVPVHVEVGIVSGAVSRASVTAVCKQCYVVIEDVPWVCHYRYNREWLVAIVLYE